MLKFAEVDAPAPIRLPDLLPGGITCACGDFHGPLAEHHQHVALEQEIFLARITLQGGIR